MPTADIRISTKLFAVGCSCGSSLYALVLYLFLETFFAQTLTTLTDNYHISHGVHDTIWIKIMVYVIFLLEVVQSGLMGADAYRIFGPGFGDLEVLDINHTDWFGVCFLGAIVAAIVQSFYTFRLWKFTRSWLVVGTIGMLVVVQLVTAFIQGVMSALLVTYSKLQERPANVAVWTISAAVCDLLIAVFMVYYLRKGRTGFNKTDRVISKLVRFSIETGIITALMAISLVVLFLVIRGKSYFEISARGLAKVYSNQLMMVLNSRERVKKSSHNVIESSSIPLPTFLRSSFVPGFAPNPNLEPDPGSKPSKLETQGMDGVSL
ncbi:hypothetical protein DL96DRAFT_1606967 [Flagelloscypha sp. PMI_526]|nr:hypothetical protein DL96DRAFT_1606967 [Flagelloscypha sp. PMI_526]